MVPFRNEATAVAVTTVLLIDDNDEDRKYWGEVLKKSSLNYMVLEASSGDAGLDLCRSHQIDCVVLDLDMQESGCSGGVSHIKAKLFSGGFFIRIKHKPSLSHL